MAMLILIPCKNLDRSKSRLAPHLDPRSRRALCELFLCQTLALATSVVPASQVRVVTEDLRAAKIGADYGASGVPDLGIDLNSALSGARVVLMSDQSRERDVLILPIDLPYATPAALRNVIGKRDDTVIVPDSERLGTNLLFLRSSAFRHFSFAFGVNSFERHCAAAKASCHAVEIIVNDERLSRDVDQPVDYVRWAETMSRPLSLLGCGPHLPAQRQGRTHL